MTESVTHKRRKRHRRRRGFLRRAVDGIVGVFAVVGLAAVLGFIFFTTKVAEVPSSNIKADAIVALTGGQDRLADAFDLLRQKRATRMLISGVHPTTNPRELERVLPGSGPLLGCCVDLDHQALTTAGNALATKLWVETHGYKSVILVTSGWHMPRAQAELSRSLPGVQVIPYPVVTGRFRDGTWWQDSETLTTVIGEYIKYVAALAHVRIAPRIATEAADVARAGHDL
ncbi:hypothetical protein GCM10007276_30160 [Agaricicola taiwanensis]|uniref:DUF218 domain-containing protein n=1 Tax=Agaricicola taiwanensis TaxID=591372 RepID=A0A8J2YKS4_9RHOB|nr:YdcF family protein [Agaricicola taiwanensis]GGE51105.1 hypothetical protein GCM10007276_30160 [Agaricicola taiwanensis]